MQLQRIFDSQEVLIFNISLLCNCYIKTFTPKSLSSQLFHADERLQIFVLGASVLGMISSMRLDGKKDIRSVKSAWSVLHAELKSRVLLPLLGNNKGRKINIHTHTHTHTHTHKWLPRAVKFILAVLTTQLACAWSNDASHTKTMCEICSNLFKSLLLTLNRFYTFLWNLHWLFWTSKYQVGSHKTTKRTRQSQLEIKLTALFINICFKS